MTARKKKENLITVTPHPFVACDCGNGDNADGHKLSCAKWIAILPNHMSRTSEDSSVPAP